MVIAGWLVGLTGWIGPNSEVRAAVSVVDSDLQNENGDRVQTRIGIIEDDTEVPKTIQALNSQLQDYEATHPNAEIQVNWIGPEIGDQAKTEATQLAMGVREVSMDGFRVADEFPKDSTSTFRQFYRTYNRPMFVWIQTLAGGGGQAIQVVWLSGVSMATALQAGLLTGVFCFYTAKYAVEISNWINYGKPKRLSDFEIAELRLTLARSSRLQLGWRAVKLVGRSIGFEAAFHYLLQGSFKQIFHLDLETGVAIGLQATALPVIAGAVVQAVSDFTEGRYQLWARARGVGQSLAEANIRLFDTVGSTVSLVATLMASNEVSAGWVSMGVMTVANIGILGYFALPLQKRLSFFEKVEHFSGAVLKTLASPCQFFLRSRK